MERQVECSDQKNFHFFPASIASPFLHAMILILDAVTISFDSILNEGFFTINVQTSSQSRYVCKCPCFVGLMFQPLQRLK